MKTLLIPQTNILKDTLEEMFKKGHLIGSFNHFREQINDIVQIPKQTVLVHKTLKRQEVYDIYDKLGGQNKVVQSCDAIAAQVYHVVNMPEERSKEYRHGRPNVSYYLDGKYLYFFWYSWSESYSKWSFGSLPVGVDLNCINPGSQVFCPTT